ncbi:hypothetical protein PUN28_001504 [Cardiocondyla obscurior]|uniref:Uncharacterized protein n=1 Tax=Cardiocondyla obscurior TaxID=286306 RepID=A0AAW2H5X8_9HYME
MHDVFKFADSCVSRVYLRPRDLHGNRETHGPEEVSPGYDTEVLCARSYPISRLRRLPPRQPAASRSFFLFPVGVRGRRPALLTSLLSHPVIDIPAINRSLIGTYASVLTYIRMKALL